jgi:hypothetical protein
MKLYISFDDNGRNWHLVGPDGERITNVLGLELTQDLSSIGLQEDRVLVELSIEKKYILKEE